MGAFELPADRSLPAHFNLWHAAEPERVGVQGPAPVAGAGRIFTARLSRCRSPMPGNWRRWKRSWNLRMPITSHSRRPAVARQVHPRRARPHAGVLEAKAGTVARAGADIVKCLQVRDRAQAVLTRFREKIQSNKTEVFDFMHLAPRSLTGWMALFGLLESGPPPSSAPGQQGRTAFERFVPPSDRESRTESISTSTYYQPETNTQELGDPGSRGPPSFLHDSHGHTHESTGPTAGGLQARPAARGRGLDAKAPEAVAIERDRS